MKNTKPKVRLWSVLTGLTAILTVAAIVGNIIANQYATTLNVALNASTYKIIHGENTGDTEYFKKGFASDEEREAYEAELCATVEAEGAALLKNENNALPLASGAKVSLFGHGSVDLMYGGTGSGSVDTSKAPNLKQALEAQGITINQTLWDLYSSDSMMSKYSRMTPASISDTLEANTQYAVNEAPWSALSSAESSFAEYGDAAIVVLSRSGGEGADLPSGENGTSDSWISGQEGDGNYLALSAEEIELLQNLKALKDNGTFKNIIVLINSSNAIELDFLNPEICGEDYGIDAAMWIGDVGQTGINGVGQLLSGAVTPSGSLVDTYLYDNMANPAMYNFYTQAYPNAAEYNLLTEGPDVQGMYSVYQEGIYLGYRYFETRYEDVVMGTAKAGDYNWATTVAYPFGYGDSYTTFAYSNFNVTESDDTFTVTLKVTNTGKTYSGKETVQVYFQSPYTDYDKANGIEKAAAELCGFAKTDVLAPVGIVISILLTLLAVIGIWEKDQPKYFGIGGEKTEKIKVSEYIQIIKNNDPMQRLMVAGAGCKLALSITTNTTVLCMLYGCMMGNYDGLYLPMMVLGYVCSVPFFLLTVRTSQKEGQKASLMKYVSVALVCYVGVLVLLLLWGRGDAFTLSILGENGLSINLYTILFIAFFGIGYGAYYATADMPIPMVADCSDYETYRSGKYIPGIMGTLFSLVDKLVSSLSATVVGIAVSFVGLQSLPTQYDPYTPGMNWVVIVLFCIIPMVAWAATLIAMKGYTLTGAKMKEIQAVNACRRDAVAKGMKLEEAMDKWQTMDQLPAEYRS